MIWLDHVHGLTTCTTSHVRFCAKFLISLGLLDSYAYRSLRSDHIRWLSELLANTHPLYRRIGNMDLGPSLVETFCFRDSIVTIWSKSHRQLCSSTKGYKPLAATTVLFSVSMSVNCVTIILTRMLSAVPFRADGTLYVILFGATQQSACYELNLKLPLQVVLLHITDLAPYSLASRMSNNWAYIGFSPEHSFVRPTPRGPRQTFLPGDNSGHYLGTLGAAVARQMGFDLFEIEAFERNLEAVISELLTYLDSGTGADRIFGDNINFRRFIHQLTPRHLSYVEFILLLQTAATQRQEERRWRDVSHSYTNDEPIDCFQGSEQFEAWLYDWTEVTSYGSPTPTASQSQEHQSVQMGQGPTKAGPASATSVATTPTLFLCTESLASKRRSLDTRFLTTSFCECDRSLAKDTDRA